MSLKSYICVLIVVSTNLLIKSYFIVYLLPLSIGITTFFLFIIFLILNHYGFLFQFNSKASIFSALSSPLLYLSVFMVCCISFIFDYSAKMINLLMSNSLSSKLIISRTIKKKNLIPLIFPRFIAQNHILYFLIKVKEIVYKFQEIFYSIKCHYY